MKRSGGGGLLEVIPIMQLLPDTTHHPLPAAPHLHPVQLHHLHICIFMFDSIMKDVLNHLSLQRHHEAKKKINIWLSLPSHLSGLATENAPLVYT